MNYEKEERMKIDSRLRHNHVSLFSGIGGIDYAAHIAGFRSVAFVEREPYCQAVLGKNFPGVPIYDDVRSFDIESFRRMGGGIDLLSGGFPCQDISIAGRGAGLEGEKSGLWFAMLELIRRGRPRFVLAENVPALYSRGIDIVLSGLEEAGYTAEPFVVAAEDVGAPHKRERVFIVAHAKGNEDRRVLKSGVQPNTGASSHIQLAYTEFSGTGAESREVGGQERRRTCPGCTQSEALRQAHGPTCTEGLESDGSSVQLGDSQCGRLPGQSRRGPGQESADGHLGDEAGLADSDSSGWQEHGRPVSGGEELPASELSGCVCGGRTEPGVGRAIDGFPAGMDGRGGFQGFAGWPAGRGQEQKDWEAPRLCEKGRKYRAPRLKALGNAVVPWQVLPFLIAISQKLDEEKS